MWRDLVILIALVLFWPVASEAHTGFEFDQALYHTCYDGDTCMLSLPGVHPLFGDHILVRFAGIDTPEMKGQCERETRLARQARDLVRSILSQAERIKLHKASRDKYFRINARVIADGQDLSEMLVAKGLATPYDGGTKTKDWCAETFELPYTDDPSGGRQLFSPAIEQNQAPTVQRPRCG
jgi:micrococcal nuclease